MDTFADAVFNLYQNQKRGILERIQQQCDRIAQLEEENKKSKPNSFAARYGIKLIFEAEADLARLQADLKQAEERLQKFKKRSHQSVSSSVNAKVQEALQILGLSAGGLAFDRLKETYHNLAKQHHPDAGGNTAMMARINRAYKVLNEWLRRES